MSDLYTPTAEWTPGRQATAALTPAPAPAPAGEFQLTDLEDFVDHDWTEEHATDWSQFGY
jgi:hypothetical protein